MCIRDRVGPRARGAPAGWVPRYGTPPTHGERRAKAPAQEPRVALATPTSRPLVVRPRECPGVAACRARPKADATEA
eukprot:14973435-Alexandrium_andersonii.AAC.1